MLVLDQRGNLDDATVPDRFARVSELITELHDTCAQPHNQSGRGGQLFGPWAIDGRWMHEAVSLINGRTLTEIRTAAPNSDFDHRVLQPTGSDRQRGLFETINGTAIIHIDGPLTKHETSFQELFGGTSTSRVRRAVRLAASDDGIRSVLLQVDSPGGTVAGSVDLADDVRELAKVKPVHAYIEDLGASAAYHIASGAHHVIANRSALVGSIGAVLVIYDDSARAEKLGVKVHVVQTGPLKRPGEPGTEVTDEHLAYFQRIVDGVFAVFRDDVMQSRSLTTEQFEAVRTGEVFVAARALELKLIDAIGTLDEAVSGAIEAGNSSVKRPHSRQPSAAAPPESPEVPEQQQEPITMDTTEPKAATASALQAAFPDHPKFALECAANGLTIDAARSAFNDVLKAELKASKEETTEARADKAKAESDLEKAQTEKDESKGSTKSQTPHIADGPSAKTSDTDTDGDDENSDDPIEAFNAQVAAKMTANSNLTRDQAITAVARKDKKLHQEYLLATNPSRSARRRLSDRFADEEDD